MEDSFFLPSSLVPKQYILLLSSINNMKSVGSTKKHNTCKEEGQHCDILLIGICHT